MALGLTICHKTALDITKYVNLHNIQTELIICTDKQFKYSNLSDDPIKEIKKSLL